MRYFWTNWYGEEEVVTLEWPIENGMAYVKRFDGCIIGVSVDLLTPVPEDYDY